MVFNWMIRNNLYIGNGSLTKNPWETGRLEFQNGINKKALKPPSFESRTTY